MTLCRFFLDKKTFPADCPPNELHVLLYGGSAPIAGAVAIGNQVKDLFLRFGVQPSATAVDFVSIALAVTAADTFVLREDAADSWSRDIEICLPLRTPGPWNAVKPRLQRLLSFLSGDQWRFHFEGGGEAPPVPSVIRQHQSRINLVAGDLVSLFSGGLDSTIATFRLVEDTPARSWYLMPTPATNRSKTASLDACRRPFNTYRSMPGQTRSARRRYRCAPEAFSS
ncbi:hypothetical protein [Mesorhizobium australicum]|uniref:hypothetical protein n=1 Tax=Mesorhizobium australicum TaxID=536018 RepID=UPI0033383E1D